MMLIKKISIIGHRPSNTIYTQGDLLHDKYKLKTATEVALRSLRIRKPVKHRTHHFVTKTTYLSLVRRNVWR